METKVDKGADLEEENMEAGDLAAQLQQLQSVVLEMKEELLENKKETHKKNSIVELQNIVQHLQTEIKRLSTQVEQNADEQKKFTEQLVRLQAENKLLVEEVARFRTCSHGGDHKVNVPIGCHGFQMSSSSDLHSDRDSGVLSSQLSNSSPMSNIGADSHEANTTAAKVQPYIDGLPITQIKRDFHLDDAYESDSSITLVANKSLDLSRSLGDCCAENVQDLHSSDEEGNSMYSERNVISEQGSLKLADNSSEVSGASSVVRNPSFRSKQRENVVKEILETERKYVSCLNLILTHFAAPVERANLLSIKDINLLFSPCLSAMYKQHTLLLQQLEERVTQPHWSGVVADIFAKFVDQNKSELLLLYQQYVTEFPRSMQQMKKSCRQSAGFKKFLKKAQCHPICHGLDLGSYMMTPIQRIPRYVLLLKQLLKMTDIEDPDHYYLELTLEKLGHFLTDLNDSIEYSMKVLIGDSNKPKRRLRVGSFNSKCSSENSSHISSSLIDKAKAYGMEFKRSNSGGKGYSKHSKESPRSNYTTCNTSRRGPSDFLSMTMPVQHKSSSMLHNKHIRAAELSRSHSDSGRNRQITREFCTDRSTVADLESTETQHGKSDLTPVNERSARHCFVQQNINAQYCSPEPGYVDVQNEGVYARSAMKPSPDYYKSMPRLPQTFGTYGANDVDPDEDFDSVSSRGGLRPSRSMSHGNLMEEVSQQQLNACLAESLAGAMDTTGIPANDTYGMNPPFAHRHRPYSDPGENVHHPGGNIKPQRKVSQGDNSCVFDSSMDLSTLNNTANNSKSVFKKFMGRDRKKLSDSLNEGSFDRKRSANLKSSIKNMFKKRNSKSKIVEESPMITDLSYERTDFEHRRTPPLYHPTYCTNPTSTQRKALSTLNGNVPLSVITEVDSQLLSPIAPISPICPIAKHDSTIEMSMDDQENLPCTPL